jgi:hypothetical protein
VRRGRYVEVVLGAGVDEIVVCDGMVCGAMVVRVFGLWCGQCSRQQDRSRGRSGDRGWAGPRAIADDIAVREDA